MPCSIVRNGERHMFSSETLEQRFTGVRSAVWSFWQKRKLGRVDANRAQEFMRCDGQSSFHARCMWHLLPEHDEARSSPPNEREFSTRSDFSLARFHLLPSPLLPYHFRSPTNYLIIFTLIHHRHSFDCAVHFNAFGATTGISLTLDCEGSVFLVGRGSCSDTQYGT